MAARQRGRNTGLGVGAGGLTILGSHHSVLVSDHKAAAQAVAALASSQAVPAQSVPDLDSIVAA